VGLGSAGGGPNSGHSGALRWLELSGLAYNLAGNIGSIVNVPELLGKEETVTWSAQATIHPATDSLILRVTGAAGQTIRWVASVRTSEVIFE
jgi:hypothetical protein